MLWDGGKAQELPLFAADPDGSAFAINDSGQIVGASGTCTSFNPNSLSGLQPLHALLWQNGKATDMGNLGGTGHGAGVLALTLNAHGQAVGFSDLPGDKANHAFTWTQATGMQDLGALPGDVSSVALNINDAAIVAGISFDATGNMRPFVWQSGVMTELNSLMPADSPLYILLPCGINSSGQITGLAVLQSDGSVHGFLATPSATGVTEPHETAPVTLSDAVRDQVLRQLRLRGINAVR